MPAKRVTDLTKDLQHKRPLTPTGFDVTCTVGRVEFGGGDDTAYVSAFRLIAEHGADGHYSFPSELGGTVHVTVETQPSDTTPVSDGEWTP